MCFFDGNHKILLLKAEMAQPNEFMKIVGIAHGCFAFFVFAFGAATHLVLGKADAFAVLDGARDNSLLTAVKLFVVLACFLWFLLTAQDLHCTSQKMLIMCTTPSNREGNSDLHQFISPPNY